MAPGLKKLFKREADVEEEEGEEEATTLATTVFRKHLHKVKVTTATTTVVTEGETNYSPGMWMAADCKRCQLTFDSCATRSVFNSEV